MRVEYQIGKFNAIVKMEVLDNCLLFFTFGIYMSINLLKKTAFFLFLSPLFILAQIQVSDFSKSQQEKVEDYDSTYFQPNYKFDNLPVMNGLVGHNLIFLNKPNNSYNYEIFQNRVKQTSISAFDKYLFQNCKIENVVNGQFYLSCLGDSIMYKPSSLDANNIIISEGFEKLKSKHLGKKFYSLSAVKFASLENTEIQVGQGQVLTIENIEIAKLSSYSMGLGFKFSSQNQIFTIALPFDDFYFQYGGDPKGKIVFTFEYINRLEIVDEALNSAINKSLFKKNILKGEIVVGMTEKEIRIVWGMPSRDKVSSGYEKVLIYEGGGTTYYLYMKGKKLVKISQL
jgi:hypothetical protein